MNTMEFAGQYDRHYSDAGLMAKVKGAARKAGQRVLRSALLLYYVTRDPAVPLADKAKIYGALGYFILPTDLIPDAIAGLGYTDDLTALLWVLSAVQSHITDDTRHRADERLRQWLGDGGSAQIDGNADGGVGRLDV